MRTIDIFKIQLVLSILGVREAVASRFNPLFGARRADVAIRAREHIHASYLAEIPHRAVDPERVRRNSRDAAFAVVPELSEGGRGGGAMYTTRATTWC